MSAEQVSAEDRECRKDLVALPRSASTMLYEQVELAKKTIRSLKRNNPWVLPQYLDLTAAQLRYDEAKKQLKEAKAAWAKLGR